LRQKADPRRSTTIHLTTVNLFQAGQYFQEGRFAGSVGAEETHSLIFRKTNRQIIKKRAGSEVLGDLVTCDQYTHRAPLDGKLAHQSRQPAREIKTPQTKRKPMSETRMLSLANQRASCDDDMVCVLELGQQVVELRFASPCAYKRIVDAVRQPKLGGRNCP
jgi:hypothetical protein